MTIETLARARLAAGLSQRELARRADVAYPRISEYERGRRSPTIERLEALVEATGGRLRLMLEEPLSIDDQQLLGIYLATTPAQRLESLTNFASLLWLARP